MNTNMHGKMICAVWWPDTDSEQGRHIMASDERLLTLSATHHGDHDEFWIIESEWRQGKCVEVARHNPRHVESIKWATSDKATEKLAKQGVFKGFHGLEGLANAHDFWNEQPYGTRLYYGPGGLDYLHRSVLQAAIKALKEEDDAL